MLIPRVPSEPSRHRVAVWRELRRCGAVQLGHGVWALPATPALVDAVPAVLAVASRQGGEVVVLVSRPGDSASDARLRAVYDAARRDEWGEFASECDKCCRELQREIASEKFTLAELDEEEQNVERLRRWHRELRLRDVFEAVDPEIPAGQLDACVDELERFTVLVYAAVGMS